MAHTDAHQPAWAQGTLIEYHDHRDGPCDLPPRPVHWNDQLAQTWRGATRCVWWPHPHRTAYSAYKNASNPRYDRAAARREARRAVEEALR